MALSVCEELKKRGLSVPDDIAVTGFDDSERSQYNIPSLTTVNQSLYNLSKTAFEWMYEIVTRKTEGEKVRLIPTELVLRQSCGCLPAYHHTAESSPVLSAGTVIKKITDIIQKTAAADKEGGKEDRELQSILDNLSSYLRTKNPSPFLLSLNNLLIREIIHKDNDNLLNTVYGLQSYFRRDESGSPESQLLDSLWPKVQTLLIEITKMKWGYKLTQTKIMNNIFRDFLNKVSTITDTPSLLNTIAENVPNFGIGKCFITFYKDGSVEQLSKMKWSVPKQSRLVMAVNGTEKLIFPEKGPVFKTKEILPENPFFDRSEPFIWIARPLYNTTKHFGNIIFEGKLIDEQNYINIHEIVCTGLMAVYLQEERKKYTSVLEENKKQLEDAFNKLADLDQMKTDFIHNITHEFRSPLSIIMSSADLALKYDKFLEDLPKERFNTIYDAALRLKSSIDKLMDLAKMDSKGLDLHIAPINLKVFMTELVDFYRSAAVLSNITIHSDLDECDDIKDFFSDQDKFEDILNNIFSNALKFTDQEHGIIFIKLESKKGYVRISIRDNGIGIEKELLEKIFERFVQSESGRNSRYKGTGIGLSFAQQMAVLLRGKLWAESKGKGRGTTFFLELPRGKEAFSDNMIDRSDKGPANPEKKKKIQRLIKAEIIDIQNRSADLDVSIQKTNEEGEFDYRKALILIVEDNFSLAAIEKEYLEKDGYTNFITAYDGNQGIEAVYKYRPDIIICDYNMPGMRGDILHNKISGNPEFKLIPFVFVTAINNKELIHERKQMGAIAYLLKPVEETELLLTVNLHLKRFMALKENFYLATIDQMTGMLNKKTLLEHLYERIMLRKSSSFPDVFRSGSF